MRDCVLPLTSALCNHATALQCVLEDEQKFSKLLELLGLYQEDGSVLVFVDKQENADDLTKRLMDSGYPCMPLHGGIDQYDRDSTISDFKSGNIKLMVSCGLFLLFKRLHIIPVTLFHLQIATSIAARGLDVKELILVVNYDCPNHYEDYVHRCGSVIVTFCMLM